MCRFHPGGVIEEKAEWSVWAGFPGYSWVPLVFREEGPVGFFPLNLRFYFIFRAF